jgi:hypothetical protein
MFKKLAEAAQSLKEKADIGKRVEATRQFAADKFEAGKDGATAKWEQHWPAIERLLVEGLLTVAEEKLADDKMLEGAFLKFYETLPLAARFILSRERFVEFTMARRDPILLKLQDFRAGRAAQGENQVKLLPPAGPDV